MNTVQQHRFKDSLLVVGGAGFVGSHLCRKLLALGHKILCIDNLQTGSILNIEDLLGNERFKFIEHDITEPFVTDANIAEIYNLACPASPKQYQKNPIHTFKTSVIGSMNLLELAKQKGARILLASTSEVYGDPILPLQSENYWGNVNPYGIRSCYDEGKRGAETLFHDYHDMHNVDTRIIRIFNTYGPCMAMNDGRVISNFIVQAFKGEALTVHGDGTQTRSFQYIDDLIDAIMKVMQDGVQNAPINIGNPNEIPVRQLADMIIELTCSKSSITYTELPQDDPCRRWPDITLAKTYLVDGSRE